MLIPMGHGIEGCDEPEEQRVMTGRHLKQVHSTFSHCHARHLSHMTPRISMYDVHYNMTQCTVQDERLYKVKDTEAECSEFRTQMSEMMIFSPSSAHCAAYSNDEQTLSS